jgi:hypothetical protein
MEGYSSGQAPPYAFKTFNASWGARDYDSYVTASNKYEYNGNGATGKAYYDVRDACWWCFYDLPLLRLRVETSPFNVLNDMIASPFFNSSITTPLQETLKRYSETGFPQRQEVPIIDHTMQYYCTGSLSLGDATIIDFVQRTALNETEQLSGVVQGKLVLLLQGEPKLQNNDLLAYTATLYLHYSPLPTKTKYSQTFSRWLQSLQNCL